MNGDAPFNVHGGLTLVPMPGFEALARRLKPLIEAHGEKQPKEGKVYYRTPVDIAIPRLGLRENREPFAQLGKEHVGGHDCAILTSGPGTFEMLGQLHLALRYVAGRRASRIMLMCPYFPLARSDKDEKELEFALARLVVDQIIEASRTTRVVLDRIVSFDIHSEQVVMAGASGLITPLSLVRRVFHAAMEEARKTGRPLCLAFPDDGAAKRVEPFLPEIFEKTGGALPIVKTDKRRYSSSDVEVLRIHGDVDKLEGAIVLNVDDEIATLGTNQESARAFKKHGAYAVWGVVSHGVLCGQALERFAAPDCPVDHIVMADTILVENRPALKSFIDEGRIQVIDHAGDMAQVIYRHHWDDESIRTLR